MSTSAFSAMGTTVEVWADEGGHRDTRAWFDVVEAEASRFRPDSGLSLLNRHPNGWVRVSPLLSEILIAAGALRKLTGGLVDPATGGDVVRWGYDRTFGEVGGPDVVPDPVRTSRNWSVDGRIVRRAPGLQLDLGGVAKGWTADRAVENGLAALVSAGGDVRSSLPDARVEVLDPDGGVAAVVELGCRALATSSVAGRRWTAGGRTAHHLIDPRTGSPARGPIVSASAVAATAVLAEGAAKAVLLHGVDGLAWASAQPWVEGAVVLWDDGTVYATTGLEVAA